MTGTTSARSAWARIARRIRVPLGFCFAVIYLWLSRPRPLTVFVGSLVVIAGIGVRAVASGQLKKNEELATTGPYSYTRNPLYLGSILIAIGFSIAARSLWIWVLVLLLFVLIYVPVIGGEEAFLRSKFPDFDAYAKSVPRLIPLWSGQSLTANFSRELYVKHREYNALIGAVLMMLAIGIKMLEVRGS